MVAWKDIDKPGALPGPVSLPVIGALLSVGSTRHFYKAMIRWLNAYGDPYQVRLGPHRYVFTANTALARLILDSRPDGAERPEMTRIAFASIDAAQMLFSAEGRQWKAHRQQQPDQPLDFLPVAKRFSVTIISKLVFGGDFRNIEKMTA
jgi:hypothetical protein